MRSQVEPHSFKYDIAYSSVPSKAKLAVGSCAVLCCAVVGVFNSF